jgi:hypothetical protein
MSQLVFLLEEPSAQEMLKGFLPKLGFNLADIRFIVFQGKSDLDQNVERKLRAWLTPDTRFVILRDQDSGDCLQIKKQLVAKARQAGRHGTLVRIACRELESWYLGDLSAVETGLRLKEKLISRHQQKAKFRNPDLLQSPDKELRALTGGMYQKIKGSRAIGPYLVPDKNRSPSFRVFVSGLRSLLQSRV